MKKVLTNTACTLALLSAPFAVQAQQGGFNYNYVQGQYEIIDVNNDDGDGLRLIGSFDLNSNVFLIASYGTSSYDSNIDISDLNIGIGFHAPMDRRTDMVFTGSIVNAEVDFPAPLGATDDTGYRLTAGVRYSVSTPLELEGGLAYQDIFDDTDMAFYAGAVYHFSNTMSAVVNYNTLGDDTDTLAVGLRFAF